MSFRHRIAGGVGLALGLANPLAGQLVQRNAEFWLPASYNFAFYRAHPEAARSFYAAHYAHFGVYEVGLTASPDARADRIRDLEARVRALVLDPPKFEPPIDVVAPDWNRMSYRTAAAMDWTHHLHEQLYDILTDPRVTDIRTAGERAIAHYLANGDMAFSTRGYGHTFMMAGGPWAETFAHLYPGMNGILWAYHWHHAAIYEALMTRDPGTQARELERVLRVFVDSVLPNPPGYMPLTAQVAPEFSRMFPAAAQIFDNLHMMHDVVNDIMVTDGMSVAEKEIEIERMLRLMLYPGQDAVTPPALPMDAHMKMPMSVMTVPTQLPDGSWLPQGHPDADRMPMRMNHPPGRMPGGGR